MHNEEIIIDRIKKGDEDAFNQLLNDYRKMIYKIIYSFNMQNGDFSEDIESMYQEGCLALYKAVFSYEKERGAKFSSYAYMSIKSKVMNYYRKNSKIHNQEYFSIDSDKAYESRLNMKSLRVSEDPVYYHKEKEFKEYLDNFIKNLPSQDKKILELRNEDHSYKEISKELNINTKKVDNKLRVIKKQLKDYIDKNK